jgi:AcrR family transcriptional regulator
LTTGPRPYRSTLRDEQSRVTRRRIVDAGAELFVERGYVPTTIDAIAERAGVSRRTVFTSVGSKADILKLAFDWTLAGDDEPIPIADRPVVRQLMQADDPADVLEPWLAMNAAINERIATLYLVLVVAADADPDVATLLATSDGQRLDGARRVVDRVVEVGGLRPDVTRDEAAEILDVLIDPMNYRRFVGIHGWEREAYVRHLQAMATQSILRSASP